MVAFDALAPGAVLARRDHPLDRLCDAGRFLDRAVDIVARDPPVAPGAADLVRVQVVLPGATATDFWDISGVPLAGVPTEIVMPAGAMVDAALAGLDLGETVTIPALPDPAAWDAFERARAAMVPNLSRAVPAERYRPVTAA